MRLIALKDLNTINAGATFTLPDDKASQLIQAGYAVLSDAYEERAAIMQYDGGMTQEEAEKQAWCREVCMLTAGQAELCEKINLCPRYQSSTTKRRV